MTHSPTCPIHTAATCRCRPVKEANVVGLSEDPYAATALPDGKELDALVGRRIFGLDLAWDENTHCPVCEGDMRYCGARSWCYNCHEWRYSAYPEYSESIAAAW